VADELQVNGAENGGSDTAQGPELPVGHLLEAVARAANEKAPGASPDQLRAWAEVIGGVLNSPSIVKACEAWSTAKQAEASARIELLKQEAQNADAAHKRQAEIATSFLKNLAILGGAGMLFLGAVAYFKVMEPQGFGVLASTFFTALFGTGIYGTTLKGKEPK
jgi:hypothetical protein